MQAVEGTPAEPFRLVSEPFWIGIYRDHFKRAPATLAEKAKMDADLHHSRRVAELKAIAPKLQLLDQLLPDLAKLGINLADREFTKRDVDKLGVVLRTLPSIFSRGDNKLHAALLAIGFREIERKRISGTDQVIVKHGRALHIMLDLAPVQADQHGGTTA